MDIPQIKKVIIEGELNIAVYLITNSTEECQRLYECLKNGYSIKFYKENEILTGFIQSSDGGIYTFNPLETTPVNADIFLSIFDNATLVLCCHQLGFSTIECSPALTLPYVPHP